MPPSLLHACPATPTLLLDIPSTLSAPPGLVPRSTHKPLATPHALTDPKQPTPFTQSLSALHARLLPTLTAALTDLHTSYTGPYHHPRSTDSPPPPGSELDFHACTLLQSPLPFSSSTSTDEAITLTAPTTLSDISDIHGTPVTNASASWLTLTLTYPSPPKLFHLPPHSTFLLSRFQSSTATFSSYAAAVGRFDFTLLDPPWPNRSAARSAAYATLSRFNIHELLQLPLGAALAPGALVGVWITNKPRYRAFVVEKLFVRWGVEEAGEWVWVKVTAEGEPVVALEAAMRKPGRAGKRVKLGVEEAGVGVGRVPGRTVVAVPDLHSRKPGVKELVEPYLPENYRACEIFGRNLTEGWFTWGDEAIKFNWDGHWKPEAENITTTAAATATAADAAAVNGNGNGNGNGDEIRDDEMTDE
ncbi:uncharacterized protein LAJ45_00459 [Morchella importuna]|uniref:uncharacterized protein n=1 Tax=Morchella importuna TaxID=1174673 RepID=UPI001E8D7C56|nr:uncharacterized protein LAJ45_00459 [Morchella importuna]KAH8155449.1 hypothetical protein LAJ45_00459 [Morchella importuna]